MKILCPNGSADHRENPFPETLSVLGSIRPVGESAVDRCQTCEKTFCSNTGTPYYRLQHRRVTFDQVARLSVEGLNKSAIARVERIGWNTVDRWLEKARDCGRRFNDQEITGFGATEFQADDIRTITQGKQQPTWIFAAIEVWSRLWASTVVGRRSYHTFTI
jgi:hypothetical protein